MSDGPSPLVVRLGAVGDMINLTVLLDALAARWGRPCDLVSLPGAPLEALAGISSVGEAVTLSSRRAPYPLAPGQWRLVSWLRRRGPSPVWVVEERDDGGKMDWLLSRGGLGPEHRLTMRDCPRELLEHGVDYLLRLAGRVPPAWSGAPLAPLAEPPRPRLAVSAAELDECRRWVARRGWEGAPLVVLQTEARRMNRGRWPAERWAAAIRTILDELPGAVALLAGSPAERRPVAAVAAACGHPRVHEVAGELPLRRLFALLSLAHSTISLDTGPAHAAAAVGGAVVVLMGTADPRRNRPFGPPERVAVVTLWPREQWPATPAEWWDRHDMAAIPVAAVVDAWRRVAPAHRDLGAGRRPLEATG